MSDMKVLVIIPAFNEQGAIANTIECLKKEAPDCDYVVVNDKSTDRTEEILETMGANYISLPINLGIGGAVQTGYKYALENGYDIAIQMDGDGQHDPSYLNKLIEPIVKGEADVCIGSRFVDKKGFQSSLSRRMGIRFLSNLVYLNTGKRVLDVTSGYRAVNREYLKLYADKYPQDYPEPEAIVMGVKSGARIQEVAVVMNARTSGESSINFKKSVYYMVKVSLALMLANIAYGKGKRKNK